MCGLCVEACPCDAIRMDTGVHAHPTEQRYDAILGKNDLMSRGTPSIADAGRHERLARHRKDSVSRPGGGSCRRMY